MRYLTADDTHPDHDTIAKFRREERGACSVRFFVQLLRLARQAGLLKLGVLALDGTKLEANATKRKTLTYVQVLTGAVLGWTTRLVNCWPLLKPPINRRKDGQALPSGTG